MGPSLSIVREANKSALVVDSRGRRLTVRRLTALDTLRLFKAAGPILAQNEPWLSMAGMAFSVLEIDGVPVPSPATEAQIESVIERLGDEGLIAVSEVTKGQDDVSDERLTVGNLPGTPF